MFPCIARTWLVTGRCTRSPSPETFGLRSMKLIIYSKDTRLVGIPSASLSSLYNLFLHLRQFSLLSKQSKLLLIHSSINRPKFRLIRFFTLPKYYHKIINILICSKEYSSENAFTLLIFVVKKCQIAITRVRLSNVNPIMFLGLE